MSKSYLTVAIDLEYGERLALPIEKAIELITLVESAKLLKYSYGDDPTLETKACKININYLTETELAEIIMSPLIEPKG